MLDFLILLSHTNVRQLREAIKKKKLRNFGHCPKRGGGSAPQPNFLSKKSMDMCKRGATHPK